MLNIDGHRAVAILHLVHDIVNRGRIGSKAEPLVEAQALADVLHVVLGHESRDGDLHLGLHRLLRRLTRQFAHRLCQQLTVQLKSDGLDVTVLVIAEDVARTAHVEVVLRNGHARAKLGVLHEHLEPPLGVGRQAARIGDEKVAVGAVAASAHPSAELVELRETELVGMVDEHRVGGRDVDARLNNGRGDEHIDAVGDEVHHHLLELVILHLCVADAHARLRHHPPNLVGQAVDGIDPVVHEVDLAAARQLLLDALAHDRVAEARQMGPHRQPARRRRGDDRQVADAEQRHLERARDGRSGHR